MQDGVEERTEETGEVPIETMNSRWCLRRLVSTRRAMWSLYRSGRTRATYLTSILTRRHMCPRIRLRLYHRMYLQSCAQGREGATPPRAVAGQ